MSRNKPFIWIERQFAFGIPIELAPNLLERLRGVPVRLEAKFAGSPAGVTERPEPDKWSVQEHVGHLLSAEELWHKRFNDFANNSPELYAADVTGRRVFAADYNSLELADILRDFRASREEMVSFLEGVEPEYLSRTSLHPRLQKTITPVDLMFFIAEHDDHHLAFIDHLMR
jgi:uncharacterized damage-inducible protein DinB